MHLIKACQNILDQLSEAVQQMAEKDFIIPAPSLSDSSIGQHVRHTLEFFTCLQNGFESGVVNYDKRAHDKQIENNKKMVLESIRSIAEFVGRQTTDRKMFLEVSYEYEYSVVIETNYFRELTYNIEHLVHHMAIMKIGIREVAPYVKIASDFGVAVSTIRFKEALIAR